MRTLVRRLALTFSALIAGSAIAMAVAAPAQATVADCVSYLVDKGYSNSTAMKNACTQGSLGTVEGDARCKSGMKALGVSATHGATACARA
jgi:hypothetical protein